MEPRAAGSSQLVRSNQMGVWAGAEPDRGKMKRAIAGCTWKTKNALQTAGSGVLVPRGVVVRIDQDVGVDELQILGSLMELVSSGPDLAPSAHSPGG